MDSPRTDAAAYTHARQQLTDRLIGTQLTLDVYDTAGLAEVVADAYTVRFQRYVNAHGVPVRRVVLYGPEECDPTTPRVEPAGTDASRCPNCAPGYGCESGVYVAYDPTTSASPA